MGTRSLGLSNREGIPGMPACASPPGQTRPKNRKTLRVHVAARARSTEQAIEYLVSAGAAVNAKDARGLTPLDVAVAYEERLISMMAERSDLIERLRAQLKGAATLRALGGRSTAPNPDPPHSPASPGQPAHSEE